MNYLVTGGIGFIGAHVTRRLVREGHAVTAFDLKPDHAFLAELMTAEELRHVAVVTGDVTEFPSLLRATANSRAKRIVHLAALLGQKSEENPLLSLRVNCEANINVFEIALALGVERVVWGSSVAVFGPPSKRPHGEIANGAVHMPVGLYGACKSLTEHFSRHYRRSRGLDVTGLRFTLVYGHGKSRTIARGTGADFLSQLVDCPALGKPGVVPAGDALIDFVYIEDAARAVVLASQASHNPSVGLTIGGQRCSLREAAGIVKQIMPEVDIQVEDGSWNRTDHNYDINTAFAEIGYRAEIGLDDGFKRAIEDVRRFGAPV